MKRWTTPPLILLLTPALAVAAPEPAESEPQSAPAGTTATLLGTAPAERADTARPYHLFATLSQNLGAGTFVQDKYARNPDYSYSVMLGASYRLLSLGDGWVSASAFVGFNQSLTRTAYQGGTRSREFYLQDLRLRLNAQNLYIDPATDIVFGLYAGVSLPTSKQSLTAQRWVRASVGANMARAFEHVGPGSILLRFRFGVQKDFGDAALVDRSSRAICRSSDCLSGIAGNNWSFGPQLSADYQLSRFTFSVSLGTSHAFKYSLANSDTSSLGYQVGRSAYASEGQNYAFMTNTTIAAAYSPNDYFAVTLGVQTVQPYDIQNSDGSRSPRFPFFDFQSTQRNYSSFFLDFDFTY